MNGFVFSEIISSLIYWLPSTKCIETFHDEGQIDMYAAMKAYCDIGFKRPISLIMCLPWRATTMIGQAIAP
jgi:D-mannonate dehydratase